MKHKTIARLVLFVLLLASSLWLHTPVRAEMVLSENFDSPLSNWTLLGSAAQDTNWLRLTPATANQVGNAVYNVPLPIATNTAYDIQFDYAMYGGSGADGLAFYLIDGSTAASQGYAGGYLGYRGVTSGYFGLGFTKYLGTEAVKLWGSGSGATGFNELLSVATPTSTNGRADARPVRLVFLNNRLWVWLNGNPLIEGYNLTTAVGQTPLPGTVKLGFAAGTGVNTNIHEVDNLLVQTYAPGILRVTNSGSIFWPCGATWATACDLQTALDNASVGDELWVAAGEYRPNRSGERTDTFQLKSGVAVYGGFTGTETSRDQRNPTTNLTTLNGDLDENDSPSNFSFDEPTRAENVYHVVIGASQATLDGFTISGGNAYNRGSCSDSRQHGGGLFNQNVSNLTLTRLKFTRNSAGCYGGGMYNNTSSLTLTDISFNFNVSARGGGMYNNASSPTLTNIFFGNNSVISNGGGLANTGNSNPLLINVTISNNLAINYGGGIYNDASSPTLRHVTLTGNEAGFSGGGIYNSGSNAQVQNSIIWGNTSPSSPQIEINFLGGGTTTVTYSVVQGGCPVTLWIACNNIITTDPQLGSPGNHGGLTQTIPIRPGSSAINAGHNDYCVNPDQRGIPRPQIAWCDLGAYEAFNPLFVKPAASGTGQCTSWTNACTLQTALTFAASEGEIWVTAGTYTPTTTNDRTATFQLKDGVAVYGGFAGTETSLNDRNPTIHITTLSGDLLGNDAGFTNNNENSYNVVTGANNATLDGFTITGGNANGPFPFDRGGGMYNYASSPTVTNVTFSGNSAVWGGGMYNNSSSPTVTNVTFSGNSAVWGSGMYNNSSSPTVTNVTFTSNSANSYGGGMTNITSNPTVTNVTFSGNSAPSGGGMFNYNSSPVIRNSILWGNTPDAQIYNDNSTPTVSDTAVQGGYSGGTNILTANPLLGTPGNYGGATQTIPLLPGSPALDAGNSATCPATDQRGVARHDGNGDSTAVCDIGAYEGGTMQCGVTAGNSYTFPIQSAVSIRVNSAGDLRCLYVDQVPVNHPNATGAADGTNLRTGKYWFISGFQTGGTTPAVAFNIHLTLPYASASASTRACRWLENSPPPTGSGWNCADATMPTTFVANSSVTRQNVTALSQWAVGDGVGPTAVSLSSFSPSGPVGWVGWWVGLLGMGGMGTAVLRRRKR